MAIVKIIEVIAVSDKSFDDATRNALAEAAKTVKNYPFYIHTGNEGLC